MTAQYVMVNTYDDDTSGMDLSGAPEELEEFNGHYTLQ